MRVLVLGATGGTGRDWKSCDVHPLTAQVGQKPASELAKLTADGDPSRYLLRCCSLLRC